MQDERFLKQHDVNMTRHMTVGDWQTCTVHSAQPMVYPAYVSTYWAHDLLDVLETGVEATW